MWEKLVQKPGSCAESWSFEESSHGCGQTQEPALAKNYMLSASYTFGLMFVEGQWGPLVGRTSSVTERSSDHTISTTRLWTTGIRLLECTGDITRVCDTVHRRLSRHVARASVSDATISAFEIVASAN